MSERCHLSPNERLSVLLFFALFAVKLALLSTLVFCATDYWLLGSAELCRPGSDSRETQATDSMLFHEGLFWRCSFPASSPQYSLWNLWISPNMKVCQPAFLFPFPAKVPFWVPSADSPEEPYEHHKAIIFRTFWSIFLIAGVATVVTGGLSIICTAPLSNYNLYKLGGALLLCGGVCQLIVVLMYVMWVQVLDTLEEFARGQHASGCTSFHLSIQNGPSFLLAPVAAFFSLLSGLLFLAIAHSARPHHTYKTTHTPELQTEL
ncbi:transmembrane protein 182-like [Syngnathus acus]|uniref:transmembrane protein 182-like n=1 Tax=Syngnathus acus TaxID=161584 RepID=UPI0018862599|nr:transmembrane protein 182-like [Syngnathus acus]